MTKYLKILLLCISSIKGLSQQKLLSKYIVTHATINGYDVTDYAVSNSAMTVFYKEADSTLFMANVYVVKNTQSYGKLAFVSKNFSKTRDTITTNYKWAFVNDYDNKKGCAKVSLVEIIKKKQVKSIISILQSNGNITIYNGISKSILKY